MSFDISKLDANTTVDLTNCDREAIHLSGAIQNFGFLLAVSSDWIVVHTSDNVKEACGSSADDMLGQPAGDFLTDNAIHDIRTRLQWLQLSGNNERIFSLDAFGNGKLFDVAVHLSGALIVIELEPTRDDKKIEAVSMVRTMMAQLTRCDDMESFLHQAARQVRFVTNFDRVMVYRFLDDGSGEVVAEARERQVESFLGLRYPASDIPKQARVLYLRNTLRLIGDVDGDLSAIVPPTTPEGEPLDLSMSILRSISPIHLEYLRNMNVQASMSISIIVDGKLWGLFACHNFSPSVLGFERRTVAELFGQMFALELANRERQGRLHSERDARAVHDQIMSTISVDGSIFENLQGVLDRLQDVIAADGAAVWVDGQFRASGLSFTEEEMQGLVRFLNRSGASRIYATDELSRYYEPAADYVDRAAGILAIPVSRKPRDYLILTRGEIARSVTWAGNPEKPVELGANGVWLTPRKSFEAWREVVRGKSQNWTASELSLAESLRTTLLEVILRSVDESEKVRKQSQATQDLLIAELNHRVRNILTLVRGIVAQTGDGSATVAQFSSQVGGRIQSLARAHDQLTGSNWSPTSFRTMLVNEFEAYFSDKVSRIRMEGPHVLLDPKAFTTLALVVHELVTNSAKYGALSDSSGSVDVRWSIDDTASLEIAWSEKGGPPVQPPQRRGFGSTIIERSIPFDLQGEAQVDFAVTGLRAQFLIPGHFVDEVDKPDLEADREEAVVPALPAAAVSGHALLLEDNVIIALDAEDMVRKLGFSDVTVVSNVAASMDLLNNTSINFAVLDINLGSETSIPVAEELERRSIPFIFASGYGESANLPGVLSSKIILNKPYGAEDLRTAFNQTLAD